MIHSYTELLVMEETRSCQHRELNLNDREKNLLNMKMYNI